MLEELKEIHNKIFKSNTNSRLNSKSRAKSKFFSFRHNKSSNNSRSSNNSPKKPKNFVLLEKIDIEKTQQLDSDDYQAAIVGGEAVPDIMVFKPIISRVLPPHTEAAGYPSSWLIDFMCEYPEIYQKMLEELKEIHNKIFKSNTKSNSRLNSKSRTKSKFFSFRRNKSSNNRNRTVFDLYNNKRTATKKKFSPKLPIIRESNLNNY